MALHIGSCSAAVVREEVEAAVEVEYIVAAIKVEDVEMIFSGQLALLCFLKCCMYPPKLLLMVCFAIAIVNSRQLFIGDLKNILILQDI